MLPFVYDLPHEGQIVIAYDCIGWIQSCMYEQGKFMSFATGDEVRCVIAWCPHTETYNIKWIAIKQPEQPD